MNATVKEKGLNGRMAREAASCTPRMIIEGARTLDLWSDDALREEIDGCRMAELVWEAMVRYSGLARACHPGEG